MKLKRILISVLSLLMLTSLALVAACKSEREGELVEISYLSGLPESVWVGRTPDCSSLKINAVYDDTTSKEIVYDAKTFTVTVDTSAVNPEAEVVIAYNGKECKTTISVIEYEIAGVELPAFAAKYNGNTAENSSSKFIDKTQGYIVGNVNPFYFSPVVTGYDENDKELREDSVAVYADVYFYQNNEEVAIENASEYYTLNGETAAFSFTSAAADKTFLIRVYPQSLTESQLEEKDEYSVDFIVTVKDKFYNVYNAVDLLAFDNRKETNFSDTGNNDVNNGIAIYNFRAEKGMDNELVKNLEGLAIHGDISLTKADFPESYFWQESDFSSLDDDTLKATILGTNEGAADCSLKDDYRLLYRNLGKSGKFAVEGNYFTIDASAMPFIGLQSNDASNFESTQRVVSHTKLFYALGESRTDETNYTEEFAFNNISLIGNLNRNEGNYSGGLIFFEPSGAKTNIYNNVANSWYITTFSTWNSTEHGVTVEKSIYQDSYNSTFYVWGGVLTVKESIIQRAGGPLVIADHAFNENDELTKVGRTGSQGGWPAVLNFDEYTSANMYSYVSGGESWFVQMGATGIAPLASLMLKGLSDLQNEHSYIKVSDGKTLMNLIAIFKDPGTYDYESIGKRLTYGKADFGTHNFDLSALVLQYLLSIDDVKNQGLPIFYGSSLETITGINPTATGTDFYYLNGQSLNIISNPAEYYNLPIVKNKHLGKFINMCLRPNKGSDGVLGVIFGDCSVEESN